MSYAQQTSVSVERTRAEIESMLSRAGAHRFGYMNDEKGAAIAFVLRGRSVRFLVPLPDKSEQRFWQTPARRNRRTQEEAYREWEQACRSRWRALCLCIKAKLEACAAGITTFEEEFLAHFVLANNKTVGQTVLPQLKDAGASTLLLLGENPKPSTHIDV